MDIMEYHKRLTMPQHRVGYELIPVNTTNDATYFLVPGTGRQLLLPYPTVQWCFLWCNMVGQSPKAEHGSAAKASPLPSLRNSSCRRGRLTSSSCKVKAFASQKDLLNFGVLEFEQSTEYCTLHIPSLFLSVEITGQAAHKQRAVDPSRK